jgi:hypothetical protein
MNLIIAREFKGEAMSIEEKQSADEELRRKIERRAYEIWESQGCPHGRDVDHWLRAETEITATSSISPASRGKGQPTPTESTAKK